MNSTRKSGFTAAGGLEEPPLETLMRRIDALQQQVESYQRQTAELLELRERAARLEQEVVRLRGGARSAFEPEERDEKSNIIPTIARATAPEPPRPVQQAEQGIDFGAIASLSPEHLDSLPYGLITLDATGRVLHYNDTESRLVGLPKERVLGRNFFKDIAPCTRLREFEGRFQELVTDPLRVRVKTFDFVFRFPKGDQHVTVVMTPAKVRGRFHLALVRRSIDG